MVDESQSGGAQWTAWIEQQRELLRQQAAQEGASGAAHQATDEVRDLGRKWLDLGQSYLGGLAQFASRAAAQPGSSTGGAEGDGTIAPFKVGEELLQVWRTTWATASTAQQGATNAFSDLLGRLPPVGLAREHTEAWRELATAQVECQHLEQELRAVLMGVQNDALNLLQKRVDERVRNNQPIATYRDLYDLWVECAEQVYAKVAHSDAYSKLQAQLGNASMRLRARQQKVIEHGLKQFDLPTRSEVNSMHLQLRQLKQKVAMLEGANVAEAPAPATRRAAAKPRAGKNTRVPARAAKRSRSTSKSPKRTSR